MDAYIFQNRYDGFLATQLLGQFKPDSTIQKYQTTISTNSSITSSGWALGADLRMSNGFSWTGNISYNAIQQVEVQPGFLTEFNTPDYRINLGFGKNEILKNTSFNINWRWQNNFVWESKFGVGEIPAYSTLDFQVSYKVRDWKSIFRIGASNVLNQYYTTGFGNASIGGLYYFTWVFDELMN